MSTITSESPKFHSKSPLAMKPTYAPKAPTESACENGEISAEEIQNAVAALKTLDKDGDGKVSKEEILERLQFLLQPDANKDGGLDRAEAQRLAQFLGRMFGSLQRGAGRGRGGQGESGERPQRPRRPQRSDTEEL